MITIINSDKVYYILYEQPKILPCKIVKNNHSFCFLFESLFDLSLPSTLSLVLNSL